jgi:uncharacterized protein (UPF0332 family)
MKPFEDCVAKGRLKKIEPDIERVAHELETAKEELSRARTAFALRRWDETATQAYFAMSRCARAAINARGYRDTNLYGLCVGLQALFVDAGDLAEQTVKQLRDAKDLKDLVYAGGRASPDKAQNVLTWVQTMAKEVFGQLALPGFDANEIETDLPNPPDPGRTATPSWNRRPSSRPVEPRWREDRMGGETSQPADNGSRRSWLQPPRPISNWKHR